MVARRRARGFNPAEYYNEKQLVEFGKAPECPPLTADDMVKIDELYSNNFGIEEEPPKFKGTMELPRETAAAV